MYLHSTYMQRFNQLLASDLGLSLERTNNSCEGSNSYLSRFSAQRLTLRELADYVENQFKRQYNETHKITPELSDTDRVLLCI